MEHFSNDDLEYVVDDYYDVSDFEDEYTFSDNVRQQSLSSDSPDSDFEDDFETVHSLRKLFIRLFVFSTFSKGLFHRFRFCSRVIRRRTPLLRKPGTGKISRGFTGRGLIIAERSIVRLVWSSTRTTRTFLVLVKTLTRLVSVYSPSCCQCKVTNTANFVAYF